MTCSRRWLPALSSTSLDLPLSILSLLYSSALLFCQLYFPYLPPESAFFFSLCLFPFPFPHHIISLTHYHRQCRYVHLCFIDNTWTSVPVWFLFKEDCARGQWGRKCVRVWVCACVCVCAHRLISIATNAVVLLLLLPPKVNHNTYDFAWARNLWEHGLRNQTLEKCPMSLWLKREARMCRKGWTGDEEFDRGLSCSSSVERNAAVMSHIQEGACLLMTQSPQPQAPPPQSPPQSPSRRSASAARRQINQ